MPVGLSSTPKSKLKKSSHRRPPKPSLTQTRKQPLLELKPEASSDRNNLHSGPNRSSLSDITSKPKAMVPKTDPTTDIRPLAEGQKSDAAQLWVKKIEPIFVPISVSGIGLIIVFGIIAGLYGTYELNNNILFRYGNQLDTNATSAQYNAHCIKNGGSKANIQPVGRPTRLKVMWVCLK